MILIIEDDKLRGTFHRRHHNNNNNNNNNIQEDSVMIDGILGVEVLLPPPDTVLHRLHHADPSIPPK
jgi:hypothetical protein